jgi:hypothetical protein
MSVKLSIIAVMKQIAEKQQVILPPLTDDLWLHETGFDSLAFSEDAALPPTVGDFVRICENVPA